MYEVNCYKSMVTMSLSVVSLIGYDNKTVKVEGNTVGSVPPQAGKGLEADLVLVIPELIIRTAL